jgi:hypothetical protein
MNMSMEYTNGTARPDENRALDVDTVRDEDELAATTEFDSNNSAPAAPQPIDLSNITEQVKGQAQQALTQTQQAAGQAFDRARESVKSQLSSQKDSAADSLGGFTTALHQTGQQLRQNGQGAFGDYAESLAGQVDQAVAYLRANDVDVLAAQVEDYARKQPALFIGGAFVIGIALARFLKSSASAPQPNFSTASNSVAGSSIPERVYGNADPSRHLDQFSDDAIPSAAPITAHGYVAGIGVSGDSSYTPAETAARSFDLEA